MNKHSIYRCIYVYLLFVSFLDKFQIFSVLCSPFFFFFSIKKKVLSFLMKVKKKEKKGENIIVEMVLIGDVLVWL